MRRRTPTRLPIPQPLRLRKYADEHLVYEVTMLCAAATSRSPTHEHLPVLDVAQAGRWKNTATLETTCQRPDSAMVYRVVPEPTELPEAK
jgi:hypothetical protein